MAIWAIILIIAAAGGVGGAVNAFITERGFRLPWSESLADKSRIWHPGFWGNVFIGAIAAVVLGCVYGTLSQVSVSGTYDLTAGMAASAILPGIGGARILTAELDKMSLNKTKEASAQSIEELLKRIPRR